MSKVKIVGNASGSGTLTLTGPDTNSDRTITIPDETGTVALGVGIDDNADATAITIGADENIGIGVTPESHYTGYVGLDVGNNAALISNNTGTNVTALLHNSYLNSGATAWLYKNTDEASMYNQVDGKHQFKTAASGSADAAITWTTPLEIHSDGRGLSQFTAKAWAQWSGSSLIDSHNISNAVDNGTGQYTFTFSNALGGTGYSVVATTHKGGGSPSASNSAALSVGETKATGTVLIESFRANHTTREDKPVHMVVFGD